MIAVICAVLTGCACFLATRPRRSASRRLAAGEASTDAKRSGRSRVAVGLGLVALAGVTVTGLSATAISVIIAAIGVAVAIRAARERAHGPRREDLHATALAIDLVAACVESGALLPTAMAAVGGPFADAAPLLARGDYDRAYAVLAATPGLRPVAAVCRRSSQSGAAIGDELRRIAARHRQAANLAARRRSRRAAVWVVLPLGLCFLPAFVLLAVVPVVMGLFPIAH